MRTIASVVGNAMVLISPLPTTRPHAFASDRSTQEEIGKDDGLLAGIAGWTVSTAAALAGGAAIVLLSGFPKVEGGGGGTEHATGKKTHAKDTYNNQDTSKGHLGDSKDSTESVNRS